MYILGVGVAFAEEEDAGDDIVDIEGEDSGVLTEEEPEEDTVTASKDVDTTILFIEPAHNPLNTLGAKNILHTIKVHKQNKRSYLMF